MRRRCWMRRFLGGLMFIEGGVSNPLNQSNTPNEKGGPLPQPPSYIFSISRLDLREAPDHTFYSESSDHIAFSRAINVVDAAGPNVPAV
jgi:hypothetical protein